MTQTALIRLPWMLLALSGPLPPILVSNVDLTSGNISDVAGNPVDQPKADLLFMGIVYPQGTSSTCQLDLVAYLKKLNFKDLPKAIILECVDNLDHKRNISGRPEKGTKVVVETLRE